MLDALYSNANIAADDSYYERAIQQEGYDDCLAAKAAIAALKFIPADKEQHALEALTEVMHDTRCQTYMAGWLEAEEAA